MLDLDLFDKPEYVIKRLEYRNVKNAKELVNKVSELNANRKQIQKDLDTILSNINASTKDIERLISSSNNDDNVDVLKIKVREQREKSKSLKNELQIVENELKKALYDIPNIPNDNVPVGKNSNDNKVVFQTDIPKVENKIPHYELIKQFDIIDFELGNKLMGAGFPVYKGDGARLQRALINFFLDEAKEAGFKEHELPIICNEDSFYGTGQLPDKENQMYHVDDKFYLIPTAEVPLTNIYRNCIVNEDDLPIKITGYTPCFRREAGSWGKDVRGLNRLHQFDKVEIVEIVKPEESYKVLEEMRSYVEGLVQKLELPYRVLTLCTGDLGFNSAFTYDIEVYSIGQDRWLESSSISNFETYQSNRLNLRYKDKNNEKHQLHTLNGSALALPRIMAALIEKNYCNNEIKIPNTLQKYTGFTAIKKQITE